MPARNSSTLLPISIILSQISLLGADTAPAPEEAPQLAELSLEQLMEIPVESVSGVSKYQQSIRRAPAGVTVFTAADIRNYGWSTLADVLRASPGLHVRSDRFYDFVGTRGFTRPRDYNSRTLILLDGHRLDDPIYQQGAIGTDFILDLDMVDRVEVITGPGSPVYGSNAFYGAVNVIPKTGRDISGAEIGLAAGSEPSAKARVTVGDRTDSGVDYVVSATEWWSRGEDDFTLPDSWRAADDMIAPGRLNGFEAHNYDDMHHQSAFTRVSWRGLSGEAAVVRRDKDVLPAVGYTPLGTTSHAIDERAYAIVRATGEPSPDTTLNAKFAVDVYRYEGLFTPAETGFVTVGPYAKSLSLNSEVSWRQTFADVQSLIVGLEYQENLRQDYGIGLPDLGSSYYDVRESSRYLSPFAQLDWEFSPSLRASAGARYDYYDTGDERVTPRFGLIWDATSSTTLKFLYGEAFRVPNVAERYPGVFPRNPGIGPETNRAYEIVGEQRINSIWRVESHLYHVVSSDLIVQNSATGSYENADRYVTTGADVGPVAFFPSGVQFRSSVTVQETRDDSTDTIVADAPRVLGKLHLSAPIVERWLRASGELLYVGDRKDSGAFGGGPVQETGDYLTGNFTLRASRVWHRWDLAFSVYNVADARWSDPKDKGQITSPPRSFVMRATLDF
jgi:iron complex outermembrane receptor protein